MNSNKRRGNDYTTKEIGEIFDCLGIPWRDYESNIKPSGWITIQDSDQIPGIDQKHARFNLNHGGFECDAGGGDLLKLVMKTKRINDPKKAFIFLEEQLYDIKDHYQSLEPKGSDLQQISADAEYAYDWKKSKKEGGQFMTIPKVIWESKSLDIYEKAIWVQIAEMCHDKRYSYPDCRTIADKLSISKNTVRDRIEKLEKKKALILTDNPGKQTKKKWPIFGSHLE